MNGLKLIFHLLGSHHIPANTIFIISKISLKSSLLHRLAHYFLCQHRNLAAFATEFSVRSGDKNNISGHSNFFLRLANSSSGASVSQLNNISIF